ncbi:MAG: hypothetical protein AB4038_09195, partial [Prochloraceae cyanobacterium]
LITDVVIAAILSGSGESDTLFPTLPVAEVKYEHALEYYSEIFLQCVGNTGQGTSYYQAYDRAFEIEVPGKPKIFGSSDPAFRGDRTKDNPEELLIASLFSCQTSVSLA